MEPILNYDISTAEKSTHFTIDAKKARAEENTHFDGLGMVSANNSSRLLLDYKAEHPKVYRKLLDYMFGREGMGLSLIKIEMGADVDSSSGTEPAVKRSADESADVTRGVGYQLAADALTINPELKVDLLYWGIPAWVAAAVNKKEAMYQWYKQTIDAMYDTYGIRVSYVTANQNERAIDTEFIKYLRRALDQETDARYDYRKIQIVAGEEVGTWSLAERMLADGELMDAVDVISSHYTSMTNENVMTLQRKYGKKIWFSEGASPMGYSAAASRYDGNGSGISGINGMLDVATRICTAMANGMTMYEFQPVISAYYDGVTYGAKQLIKANSPWSGGYSLDTGFYMAMHVTYFIKPGWRFVEDACFGDGKAGGDGHAIVDSVYNYVACVDDTGENCSVVLINPCAYDVGYTISLKNFADTAAAFHVWETRGPSEGQDYYARFLKHIGCIDSSGGEISVVLAPYSMMTLTTLEAERPEISEIPCKALSLPYTDDFTYKKYGDDYLKSRGNAPRYTTDQGGAFEVASVGGTNVLMQKITLSIRPSEWAATPNPTTNLGDDTWCNYRVSVDAHFADLPEADREVNYLGIGARYNLADAGESGYWVKLHSDGTVELKKENVTWKTSVIKGLDIHTWHSISITVIHNRITASLDGAEIFCCEDTEFPINSGQAAIYSAFQKNYFGNLSVSAVDEYNAYITRLDDLDAPLSYSQGENDWHHNTMSSYRNYNRTLSTGYPNASLTFSFEGTSFAVIGAANHAVLSIEADGVCLEKAYRANVSSDRKAVYANYDLPGGKHTVKITVVSGTLDVDAVEFA
jgi:hypothetical protein